MATTTTKQPTAGKAASGRALPDKLLSHNGYGILKATAGFARLHRARRDLTVSPRVVKGYGPARPRSWPVYRESSTRLYVPRHYGLKTFGAVDRTRVALGDPAPRLAFAGELRPVQKVATARFLATVGPGADDMPTARHPHGGIISLATGLGKTICALYLAAQIKRKVIVVVHKEFLLHQWHERIRQFLPGARVGLIQQKKVDVRGKDIVLAMLQSLSVRQYPPEVMQSFGMVIIDESHHMSSEVFSRALPKLGARVTLALTATPTRADGLTKVFKWFLGDIVYRKGRPKNTTVRQSARVLRIDAGAAGYGEELVVRFTGNLNTAGMINRIAGFAPRTRLIAALARAVVAREDGRQVMLLSGRRRHLEDIHGAVRDLGDGPFDPLTASVGYYVGGMNQDALKASESCKIVLATYSMASEGLDIKTLNTLILCTPMSNVTQAVGRILRKLDPDHPPLLIDLVDDYSAFTRQAAKRRKVFKKENFTRVSELDVEGKPETWAGQAERLLRWEDDGDGAERRPAGGEQKTGDAGNGGGAEDGFLFAPDDPVGA